MLMKGKRLPTLDDLRRHIPRQGLLDPSLRKGKKLSTAALRKRVLGR